MWVIILGNNSRNRNGTLTEPSGYLSFKFKGWQEKNDQIFTY